YAKMSFNFGPTLLAWMEAHAPDVYQAVLEADRTSRQIFSGHGSALAQAYNHMILPLANRRDKYTQILWGIRDFHHRFGRAPEGMWLPEAAVDLESLAIMAELGITFTILAPGQAKRVRALQDTEWEDVSGGRIDPTMAYRVSLPKGRHINLFFYDDPVSRAVAFEGLLSSGQAFVQRLLDGFSEERTWPQLLHIATDGETYGHHHRHGDMALAYALHHIESRNLARLTNYGEYLESNPPTHEVEIFENSSWSCMHGVERWRSDCGCNTGGHPHWNQAWRAPLREALDWLRDILAAAYRRRAALYLKNPWKARDDYIQVILDRSEENTEDFFTRHAARELDRAEKTTVLKLMELQRHAMLMYTSCGWFFDELSGIETVQIIHYAARALQLGQELFGDAIEPRFLELLARARSNIPEHGDGGKLYEKFVKPAIRDLSGVGAHYAVSSLFEDYDQEARIFCYTATRDDYRSAEAGRANLALGRIRLTSDITRESARFCFGVLHWGDHNLSCCLGQCQAERPYQDAVEKISETFATGDFPATLQLLEKHFGPSTYSLRSLFRDKQRKILDMILAQALADAEAMYRQIYEYHAPLMRFLKDLGIPAPSAFYTAAEFALNVSIRQAFAATELDVELIKNMLEEAALEGVSIDPAPVEFVARRRIEAIAEQLSTEPSELSRLRGLETALDVLEVLPVQVNLRKTQNICYGMLQTVYPDFQAGAKKGDRTAREWMEHFAAVCKKVSLFVPQSG
ncbi:MAG: DUF3536 domain-containing protein, partial [Syntrophobacteria bacterium]